MARVWNKETPEEREKVVVTQNAGLKHRERIVENTGLARRQTASMISQVIWLLFGILEGLIILRIVFKFIAANPSNPFASLVYGITDLFLWPFYGLIGTPSYGGMALEISSFIALIVYALISWLLVKIVWLIFRPAPTEVIETYDEEIR
jgi:hypothetical protein